MDGGLAVLVDEARVGQLWSAEPRGARKLMLMMNGV